jgi:hypothetical protein
LTVFCLFTESHVTPFSVSSHPLSLVYWKGIVAKRTYDAN